MTGYRIAAVIAFAFIVNAAFSAISYTDGKETISENPARGCAGGGWITFMPEGLPNWHGSSGYHSSLWELSRFSGGREQGGKRPVAERVGGKDIELTDAMKADARRFLEETRAKGGTLIVRLGYTWSEQQGCEPSDFELVLRHIAELSDIMADFPDVVVAVEAGIAGPWGEMHSSDYCKAEYMNRVLRTYLEHLPASIGVLVRSPDYYRKLLDLPSADEVMEKLPFADPDMQRIGMYNDGYLGTWWDYGTWAGKFTRERGMKLLACCETLPYGGEMAYIDRAWLDKNRDLFDLEKWNIVQEWYTTHLNYLRNIGEGGHTLAEFLKNDLVFDSKKYAFEGMPDLHEYDGENMNKFVRDHMGYRFVVRKIKGSTVEIENTGFGILIPRTKTSMLLIRDGKVLEEVPVDFDWRQVKSGRTTACKFSAKFKVHPKGDFQIGIKILAPSPVRFANPGVWNAELGANVIFIR